tara:strand:- start:1585 stop:1842 length:258 start_codon:yes stop_codon:yes gene_type:complete
MKISGISISDLFIDNEDLYEKIVVASRRQRQIIESRSIQLEAFQDIEDTEQLDEFDHIDHDIEKPLVIAMEELFNNELDWEYPSE